MPGSKFAFLNGIRRPADADSKSIVIGQAAEIHLAQTYRFVLHYAIFSFAITDSDDSRAARQRAITTQCRYNCECRAAVWTRSTLGGRGLCMIWIQFIGSQVSRVRYHAAQQQARV